MAEKPKTWGGRRHGAGRLRRDGWLVPPDYEPLPVAAPQTWLLTEGWPAYGEVDPCERPGPI